MRSRPLSYATTLWAPLALLGCAAKLGKAISFGHAEGHGASLGALLRACSPEVLFYALGLLAFTGALAASRRWVRVATLATLHVGVPTLFSLLVAEHLFFLSSGAVGDWHLLKDGLHEFPYLLRLYRSQLTLGRSLLLAAPWLYSGVVFWLLEGHRSASWPRSDTTLPRPFKLIASMILCAAAVASLAPAKDEVAILRRAVLPALLADAMEDAVRSWHVRATARSSGDRLGPVTLDRVSDSPIKNVVIIALESVGAYATSLCDAHKGNTPFLEQLAARGARRARRARVHRRSSHLESSRGAALWRFAGHALRRRRGDCGRDPRPVSTRIAQRARLHDRVLPGRRGELRSAGSADGRDGL